MAFCGAVLAQEFPTRPVKLLVGFLPGGIPDTIARAIAPAMTSLLGQSFVVENRPGSGGLAAAQELMRAPPDGYTLMSGSGSQWAILPALRPGLYDPEKALAPVALVSTNSLYIVVHTTMGVKSLPEFIALVKSKPGAFSYGSSGNGTVHHLFMESFIAAAGLNIQHVPYKGAPQQVQALIAGDIPIAVVSSSNIAAQVKAGQLRMLVATTRTRSRLTPDVPSMSDAGMPEIHFTGDVGYFAPAGTPRAVIERLSAALAKAVQRPELLQRSDALGIEPVYGTPEQLAEIVRADIVRYTKAVKISGAKVD